MQQGYPPQQGGYPPQQGGYPPQQGGHPPQQGGYPPQQGGYPPQQGGYPPQQGGYPPQQGGYPPQQQMQQQPMQPQGGHPPQQQGGYPPQQQQMQQQPMQQHQQAYTPQQHMQQQQQPLLHQQQPMPQQQPMQMQQMQPMVQAQPVAMVAAGGGGPPIILQGGETWMLVPVVPVGLTVPPGLEYLLPCAGAHVRQKTDIVEVLTDIDTPNKYGIYNDQGQFMYYAKEKSGVGQFVEAQVLGDARGFYIVATDGMGRPSFSIARSSKLWTDAEMVVQAPPGIPAGYVSYNSTMCSRGSLTIYDMGRKPVLTVPFPSECDCNAERSYMVMSGGARVGDITRKYPGFMKTMFTNCDNFALNFPVDLDVRIKACLLGCAIMIDFIDYEDKNKGVQHQ